MSVAAPLRTLEIDIPSKPDALVRLSLLLAEDEVDARAVADLVESDMALAAAVMKAVNSSLYGLNGRVDNVHQAVNYLGTREVAGITFEMGLRAAFGPMPELEPIWERAGRRGVLMGRLAQTLGLDAWAAHSAGLFEECGKAVLFRYATDHYRAMLRATDNDIDLCALERTGFGVSHDALGGALCESWGLSNTVASCVRHHVGVQAALLLPEQRGVRELLALSAMVHALPSGPEAVDEAAEALAPQCDLDSIAAVRALRRIEEQLQSAAAHGR